MSKKKQNRNNNSNVEMLELDPLVEQAIYAKRDVFLTFCYWQRRQSANM